MINKTDFERVCWWKYLVIGLNTERYSVSNAGKCEKNADQNNSEYEHFLRSEQSNYIFSNKDNLFDWYLLDFEYDFTSSPRSSRKLFQLNWYNGSFFLRSKLLDWQHFGCCLIIATGHLLDSD